MATILDSQIHSPMAAHALSLSPPVAGEASCETLTWETLTSASLSEGVFQWRSLVERIGHQSISVNPDWVDCWLTDYGDLVDPSFLIARTGNTVRGIALLSSGTSRRNGPFRVRSRHIGTAGEPQSGSVCVEYNRLLVEPVYRLPYVNGLIHSLQRDPSWESLYLDGMPADELSHWQQAIPEATVRWRDSPAFDLGQLRQQGGELLSALGKSTRSNIRRRLRQYGFEQGELRVEWATSLAQAEEIFEELVDLHQARWTAVGEPGAFANPRFLRFQQRLLANLFPQRKQVLFRVRQRDETVGCLLLLVDDNRLLDYLSGFAPFDTTPSIGLISHYLCMEEALQRGYAAYDFLVGEKQHKANLSNSSQQLGWLTYHRPSLKTRSVAALRKLKGCLRLRRP